MATAPETVEGRNISGAQLALVVGGLVALLAVVWFFFLRGGGEEPVAEVPPTVPVATPTPEPEPTKGRKPGRGPIETFEVFAAKDPFEPLITPGAGGAAAAGDGEAAPAEEGAGEAGGDGAVDGDGGAPGGGGGGERIGGRRVRLVDVFTENGDRRAQIQVDATVYTVDVGETFAQNFRLLSTSGECATLLFGDDQFTLCEGEEILK
ncbi:MAG: hypothetical protein ABR505_04745 [Actinomycetota bacterium]